jgi:hypothetical protein
MANTRSSQLTGFDWLTNGPLAPHADVFKQYLTDRGYATTTFANCVGGIGHESTTTRRYIEADLAMKEKARARLEQPDTTMRRFQAPDSLMRFLRTL